MSVTTTDLWRMSTLELAEAIRSRQTSSQEVIEAHLRRIEAVNPSVNACTGYLGHPFKNASCEMEKVLHSLLANIRGLVYNQTSLLASSCSNDTNLM